jgi:hypothetical protein
MSTHTPQHTARTPIRTPVSTPQQSFDTDKWAIMAHNTSLDTEMTKETNRGQFFGGNQCSTDFSAHITELVDEILASLREKAAALDDDKWLYDDKKIVM